MGNATFTLYTRPNESTPLDKPSDTIPYFTFRVPYAMTLTKIRVFLTKAGKGSDITLDIKSSGSSILITPISIISGRKTSVTTAISNPTLADDEELKLFLTARDSANAATGLKLIFYGSSGYIAK